LKKLLVPAIAFLSISVLISFGLVSNQAFAGLPGGGGGGVVIPGLTSIPVGGEIIPLDTILVFGYAVLNSYWIAPTAVVIGLGIYLVKRKL